VSLLAASDAVVVLAGGLGTRDEVTEIYQDHQVPVPGVRVHLPVMSGASVASSSGTSWRMVQPSRSASTQPPKGTERSSPARSSAATGRASTQGHGEGLS